MRRIIVGLLLLLLAIPVVSGATAADDVKNDTNVTINDSTGTVEVVNATYTDGELVDRYPNFSYEFNQSRTGVNITFPFVGDSKEVGRVRISENGSAFTDIVPNDRNYDAINDTLTVDLGSIENGTNVSIVASVQYTRTLNGSYEVEEITPAGERINSTLNITNRQSGPLRIQFDAVEVGSGIFYFSNESPDRTEYTVIEGSDTTELIVTDAVVGDVVRMERSDYDGSVAIGDLTVTVENESEDWSNMTVGEAVSPVLLTTESEKNNITFGTNITSINLTDANLRDDDIDIAWNGTENGTATFQIGGFVSDRLVLFTDPQTGFEVARGNVSSSGLLEIDVDSDGRSVVMEYGVQDHVGAFTVQQGYYTLSAEQGESLSRDTIVVNNINKTYNLTVTSNVEWITTDKINYTLLRDGDIILSWSADSINMSTGEHRGKIFVEGNGRVATIYVTLDVEEQQTASISGGLTGFIPAQISLPIFGSVGTNILLAFGFSLLLVLGVGGWIYVRSDMETGAVYVD